MKDTLRPGIEHEFRFRVSTSKVEVHDGVDLISRGKHERFVIDKAKFDAKMKEKIKNKST